MQLNEERNWNEVMSQWLSGMEKNGENVDNEKGGEIKKKKEHLIQNDLQVMSGWCLT